MPAYSQDQVVKSPFLQLGDDVYAKPLDSITDPWFTTMVMGEPVVGSLVWQLVSTQLDTSKNYLVYRNVSSVTFTADAGTDQIQASGHGLTESTRVYFKGADLPAPLIVGKPYYVMASPGTNDFQISESDGGSAVDITDAGSGTMRYTATTGRSSSDTEIGTLQAAGESLIAEGELDALIAIMTSVKDKTDRIGTVKAQVSW